MNDCQKIKRLLSRFLDKEASVFEAEQIQAHLSVCPACRQELLELSGAKQIVTGSLRKTLPQDYLVGRLRPQIAQKQRSETGFSFDLLGSLSRRLIPVPAFAVALSVLFLVLASGRSTAAYSLEDNILNGNAVTSEMALYLVVGAAE